MKAADVMVTNVITVGPDACIQDVARILLDSRISGNERIFRRRLDQRAIGASSATSRRCRAVAVIRPR